MLIYHYQSIAMNCMFNLIFEIFGNPIMV